MTVFCLCHEIAHAQLGHLGQAPTTALETAADVRALDHYLALLDYGQGNRDTTVYVDPKVAGAPLVLMSLFALLEDWQAARASAGRRASPHPPAATRRAAIAPRLTPRLDPTALYLVEGLDQGITDIGRVLAS